MDDQYAQQREDLFRQIQLVLDGYPETVVLQVIARTLVVIIGIGAPDIHRAEMLLNSLPADMKPLLHAEWGNLRAHREKAAAQSDDGPPVANDA
jgi:hypothetical protein